MNDSPFYCFFSPNMQKLLLLFARDTTTERGHPSQHRPSRPPFTFMPEKVLTDAVNAFWMRTQGHLSFIGNFPVIKEEEKVCVCSCIIIHLQKKKTQLGFLRKSKPW